jgi:putative transcription antitermination factor YqgF
MTSSPDKLESPILAIDWGARRLGIAISPDGLHVFIRPHVEAESEKQAVDEVSRIVDAERIRTILIGLPVSMDGLERSTAKQVRNFGNLLERRAHVSVRYHDERLTSQMSSRLLPDAGKGKSDSLAAVLLLESAIKQ